VVAEHPEQLAEPVEPLLEQGIDGFERAVPRGDAGAPGRQDGLDCRVVELAGDCGLDLVGVVADRRSKMARPLASVASVRVSLIVRM